MARLLPYLRPLGAVLFSAGIIAACAEGGALPPLKPSKNGGTGGTGVDASPTGGSTNAGAAGSGVGAMGGDTVGGDGTGATGGSSTGATGGSATGGTGTGGTGNAGSGGMGNAGTGNAGSGGSGNGGAGGTGNGGSGGTGNGGSGGSSCEIVKYDFDGCNDGWTNTGNADWACGNPSAGPGSDHTSGTGKAWSTSPTGNQGNCTDGSLESPVIDLSGAGSNLRLRYWHWYDFRQCNGTFFGCNIACVVDTDAYAGGVVEVKNAGGSWVKLTPSSGGKIECYYVDSDGGATCSPCALDGTRGYSGTSGGWVQQEVDISAYAHSAFQVRFHSASYASDLCHPGTPGWTVDDVRIAPAGCP